MFEGNDVIEYNNANLKKGHYCPNFYCENVFLSSDCCSLCGSETISFNQEEYFDLLDTLPVYKFDTGDLNYDISKELVELNKEEIINKLYSEDKYLVKQSCFILGKWKVEESVEGLCSVLENFDDVYVKRRAILALGLIGDLKTLPYIMKYYNHRTKTVKDAVNEALSEFKEDIIVVSDSKKDGLKWEVRESTEYVTRSMVPEWNEYYPNLEDCSKEQKNFYYTWCSEKDKGNFLDIDGNLSYIFYYLYEVILKFKEDKNLDNLTKEFDEILLNYNEYPEFKRYIDSWKIEALLYLNRKNEVWDEIINQKNLSLDQILDSILFLENYDIDDIKGIDILNMNLTSMIGYKTLTDFGEKNKEEIGSIISKKLKEFENLHNMDIFSYFINLTEKDYNHVESFYSYKELEDYNSLDSYYKGYKKFDSFYFSYPFTQSIEIIQEKSIPYFIYYALICELKRIIRESENECRKQHNVPYIGEGWISETELFYQIKKSFENEIVISHGSPKWLGRQHLDIYFPKYNIGIEYQGEQHEKAIDLFGGEEGLKHRKKLDERKLKLCKENNCSLIYVYPNYDYKVDVLDKINELLEKS